VNELTDQQLLSKYGDDRSEAAFAELVSRHVDLVFSAASRLVRDVHLAEDVTQAVFIAFAQNAQSLVRHPFLPGWLHRTTLNLATKTIRTDARRRAREQEAAAMNELLAGDTGALWESIAPQLDAALGELDEADRDALLSRYFQRHSAREMGQSLEISPEAAQKRVSRAVERLREILSKRGVAVGSGGLVAAVSANAIQAAPVGLAATIAGIAAPTATAVALKTLAMTTIQKTIVIAALAAAVGTGIYEARVASNLRGDLQSLQQQQAQLNDQLRQLQYEREAATNRLAALAGEARQAKDNSSELLKLRGEVAQLRDQAAAFNPTESSMKTWASQVALLKKKLEEMPSRKIPELQFATEKDWADAAWGADLSTEDGVREALSKLRDEIVGTFLGEMMKTAFKKYLAAHDGILPADLSELKPYFDQPVTDDMLARYKLLQSGKVDDSKDLVKLNVYADDEYDSNHGMSINGAWGGRFNRVQDTVNDAMNVYQAANAGQMPTDPAQLQPYLKEPLDPITFQKYLGQMAANPPDPDALTVAPVMQAYRLQHDGQRPQSPADLLPFITTQKQMAAFEKLEPNVATLAPALTAYSAANNGQLPSSPADLVPYLTTPSQKAAYEKLTRVRN
jgi:RNA polymerase sigma factor (sigma-70 family)